MRTISGCCGTGRYALPPGPPVTTKVLMTKCSVRSELHRDVIVTVTRGKRALSKWRVLAGKRDPLTSS